MGHPEIQMRRLAHPPFLSNAVMGRGVGHLGKSKATFVVKFLAEFAGLTESEQNSRAARPLACVFPTIDLDAPPMIPLA